MIIIPEKNVTLAETDFELVTGAGWLLKINLDSIDKKQVRGITCWTSQWFAANARTGRIIQFWIAGNYEPSDRNYEQAATGLVETLIEEGKSEQ